MWSPAIAEHFGIGIRDMREFRPWQILEMYDQIKQMSDEARKARRGA